MNIVAVESDFKLLLQGKATGNIIKIEKSFVEFTTVP